MMQNKFIRKRYTISRHENKEGIHFDLFLEDVDELLTWRLASPPETGKTKAERIQNHRKVYLDFEGEVSSSRGNVLNHSTGHYRLNGALLTLEDGKSAGIYIFKDNYLLDPRKKGNSEYL